MTLFPGFSDQISLSEQIISEYYEHLQNYIDSYLTIAIHFCNEIFTETEEIFDQSWKTDVDNIFNDESIFSCIIHDLNPIFLQSPSFKLFIELSKTLALPNHNHITENIQVNNIPSLRSNIHINKACQVVQFTDFLEKHYDLKTFKIIDFGAGKGYLSTFLAFDRQYIIIAAEASFLHAKALFQRISKLSKNYPNQDRLNIAIGLISPETGASDVVAGAFPWRDFEKQRISTSGHEPHSPIQGECAAQFRKAEVQHDCLIIGLHTCGDLAQICLNLASKRVKIATIGCCYGHITQKCFPATEQGDQIVQHISKNSKNNGRGMKMFDYFVPKVLFNYATGDFGIDLDGCKQMLEKFILRAKSDRKEEDLANQIWKMKLHIIIRLVFGKVFESFIIVDRLVALRKRGVEAGIFAIINQFSPRGFGICTK
ncbi:Methyltransferase domain-containing protein [Spironucleus salmonicida]|uniref:Methyltransferase domain-containing protein n=1 Tax=Spironucleus salmonicida TaxID=348837 RepID=V6LWA3_9EUKA|nr:Methyltransferase domain-containing protein [Spironucleus salmonicida]|eukprot:EST48528.1 hypothetical protein SS50377_11138 [Spironucleus salmonicida]